MRSHEPGGLNERETSTPTLSESAAQPLVLSKPTVAGAAAFALILPSDAYESRGTHAPPVRRLCWRILHGLCCPIKSSGSFGPALSLKSSRSSDRPLNDFRVRSG